MAAATEFSLIQKYFSYDVNRDDVVLGVGDDCALLSPPQGKQLAVTVDTLISGVHFPVSTSAEDIAYKSLAVSLSDLAAMGAEPAWATLALSLPESNEQWLQAFSLTFKETLDAYGMQLVGGDTTQGPLSVTVQLTGFVDATKTMRRDAARPGDKIYVTGYLGDAALGLKLLEVHELSDPTIRNSCIRKLNRPVPRVEFAQKAVEYCSCAIDISDGLLSDLGHILNASACGAKVYFDLLPASKEFRQCPEYLTGLDYKQMLLAGGDDYELCLVTSSQNEAVLFSLAESSAVQLTHIGEIDKSGKLSVINSNGELIELIHSGYEHFADE